MHPQSKHWHLLDYIITRQQNQSDINIIQTMCGAECWTDHRLIRFKFKIKIQPPQKKQQPRKQLHCRALKSLYCKIQFRKRLVEGFYGLENNNNPLDNTFDADVEWAKLPFTMP